MIPAAHITAWRQHAPWDSDAQVEQDLVICRALVDLFDSAPLRGLLAFRGGTALHKLVFQPAARYSEDIDLVQVQSGTRSAIMDALPRCLSGWLGKPKYKQSADRLTYYFRFDSEIEPIVPLRLKVEINMTETFQLLGQRRVPFRVDSPWFEGETELLTYQSEELLGTKLRALYQRSKGRDLFDLSHALETLPELDRQAVVDCFVGYLKHQGLTVSRAQFEAHMQDRLGDRKFTDDVGPLLTSAAPFDARQAYAHVHEQLISRLPGAPWKGLDAS